MPINQPYGDAPTPPSSGSSRSASPSFPIKFKSLKQKVYDRVSSQTPFFSLEFFPPRTASGALNLLSRMERMSAGNPLFCDITWHVAGNPSSNEPTSSMTFATTMINHLGLNTMLHITCCGQTREEVHRNLRRAKEQGISALLILRGDQGKIRIPFHWYRQKPYLLDPPKGEEWQSLSDGFNYAADFVRYVRDNFPDTFSIAVAGYPSGHPESSSYEDDLSHLKVKVDAGADFIVSQLFFSSDDFIKFVRDCRRIGIECPIIPGILPIQGYQSLRHIAKLGGIPVPPAILEVIEPIRDDDEAIRKFGIDFGTEMCRDILASDIGCGLHFYTLNREVACIAILKNVGLWSADVPKALPWKPTANVTRFHEDVRPIFWSSRPHSYVARTSDWEEFPNGRWGNSSAATFGELDHHIFYMRYAKTRDQRLRMWGQNLYGEEDVWKVFEQFITSDHNDQGEPVCCIPWNEDKLAPETQLICDNLAHLNKSGVLTINSQPPANGVPSTDPTLGWGSSGGYVYQKAYLEFFVSAKRAMALKQILAKYEPRVNYHIINSKGDDDFTNCDSSLPIAVTWGVFPGKEIAQPTVVDPIAFKHWKDEAFSLWNEHWGTLYPPESISRKVINHIVGNYYLVNLVDNDFPEPSILWQICDEMLQASAKVPKINAVDTKQSLNVTDPSPNPHDHLDTAPRSPGVKSPRLSTPGSVEEYQLSEKYTKVN